MESPSRPRDYEFTSWHTSIEDYFYEWEKKHIGEATWDGTACVLEKKIASLENAERVILFSSGMAALSTTLLSFLHAGDHLLAHRTLSASTEIFLSDYLTTFGIQITRVDFKDLESIKSKFKPETKLLLMEFPSNPLLEIFDIASCAQIAHQHGCLLAVDHTFASPSAIQPVTYGADIVLNGIRKYMGGNSETRGGYAAGNMETIGEIVATASMLGHELTTTASYGLLQDVNSMEINMDRQSQNALDIAQYLASHDKIAQVLYPGLKTHPGYSLAQSQMKKTGGMISFYLKRELDDCFRLLNNLRVCYVGTGWGDMVTLLEHPASMSYLSIPPDTKKNMGITDNLIRISLGLEDVEEIIQDLDHTLRKV